MYVRAVRFTDVDSERVAQLLTRIDQSDGPPEGVPATGLQILVDESQGTALVLQMFDSADDLRTGEQVFEAMDPADTPGTRASVDRCELKLDLRAPQAAQG